MRALHLTMAFSCLGLLSCGEKGSDDSARCGTELASFDCPASYAPASECRWPGATVTWGKSQTTKQQILLVDWSTHGFACFFAPTSLVLEGAVRWGDQGTFCDGGAATVRAGEVPNGMQIPPKVKPIEQVDTCAPPDGGADAS